MPQKRNPSGCALVLAAATRMPGLVASYLTAMPQEHERGVGGIQAEWPIVSAVVQSTGAAVAALAGGDRRARGRPGTDAGEPRRHRRDDLRRARRDAAGAGARPRRPSNWSPDAIAASRGERRLVRVGAQVCDAPARAGAAAGAARRPRSAGALSRRGRGAAGRNCSAKNETSDLPCPLSRLTVFDTTTG